MQTCLDHFQYWLHSNPFSKSCFIDFYIRDFCSPMRYILVIFCPLFFLSSCSNNEVPDKKLKIISASIETVENEYADEGKVIHDSLRICFDRELSQEDFKCNFGPICSHYVRFKFKFSNGKLNDWYTPVFLGQLDLSYLNGNSKWRKKCFDIYVEPHCYKSYYRFNDCSTYKIFEKGKVSDLVVEYYWQNKHLKGTKAKQKLIDTFKKKNL